MKSFGHLPPERPIPPSAQHAIRRQLEETISSAGKPRWLRWRPSGLPIVIGIGVVVGGVAAAGGVALSQNSPLPSVPSTIPPRSLPGRPAPTPTSTPPIPPGQYPPGHIGAFNPSQIHSQTLHHVDAPAATGNFPSCQPQHVSAAVTSLGPYVGMGHVELLVSLSSSSKCFVDGYPGLVFGGSVTTILQGGAPGNYRPPSKVLVGPGKAASFVLAFDDSEPSCQTASSAHFTLSPGGPEIPIALDPVIARAWGTCSPVNVTPFEQGNSVDNYA